MGGTIMNNNYYYQIALRQFIFDPKNPSYNFYLARFYEDSGHTASAISFYIRTVEFSNDDLLIYEALIRQALCLEKQGSRTFVVKGLLLRAISLLPKRPEAYFLLSRTYERNKDWQEAYTTAIVGENFTEEPIELLKTDVDYPGKYGFTFEKAVVSWWLGLWGESLFLFRRLNKDSSLSPIYKQAVKNNLNSLPSRDPFFMYDETLHEELKVKFPGSRDIKKNYSQSYQDMFVLTMLNGKRDGKYVEIGCATAGDGNNTTLLEQNYNWSGISLDIQQSCVDSFNSVRKNKAICEDALKVDYKSLLTEPTYDYLQVDCDPPIITFEILQKIPFDTHKFAVITFEHDHYLSEDSMIRQRSRDYLTSLGYVLCVSDIGCNKYNSFEDWWIHPDLIDKSIFDKMVNVNDYVKRGDDHMLNKV
jgi:hypothetical protein